jgi:hypothetical protein
VEARREALHEGRGSVGGEAGALAAVAVVEGKKRPLARARRRPQAQRPQFQKTIEERLEDVGRIEESESFPEVWR